ncbi:MAG: glycoside hydrolase domain-containing protein [Candidatus Zipacnadales bacterium]
MFLLTALALLPSASFALEYRVPLMTEAPTLDGRIDANEWRSSAGFDGFAFGGRLERRRVWAYVGATSDTLCFAFRSQLPTEGELLAQVNADTLKVVYDDSIEVWIDPTPGSEHGSLYQMLVSPTGRRGYKHHARGNVREDPSWRGDWQVANGFQGGEWHAEVLVPIVSIAPHRSAEQGVWGINLCRNWKQPWAFSSLGGGPYAPEDLRFTFVRDSGLAIHHETEGDPFTGNCSTKLILANYGALATTVSAQLRIAREPLSELVVEKNVEVSPGEKREVRLPLEDLTTSHFSLTARVTSPDASIVYYERTYAWERGEPGWVWKTPVHESLPIDLQFAYYPYLNRMRILADISNLRADAQLDRLTGTVRKKGLPKAIKTVILNRFTDGRQEIAFALPPLEGEYELSVRAEGQNVPEGELIKEFERTVYEWEHQDLGISETVYPPFTPLNIQGKCVSAVLREHLMNDLGLWDQVTAAGQPLLQQPMCFRATVDGEPVTLSATPLRFTLQKGAQAVAQTWLKGEGIAAEVRSTWDYDGLMRVDLKLRPQPHRTLQELSLEVPLRSEQATMLHAMGDGIRNTLYERVPPGEGVVWTSERTQSDDLPKNFCSYLFVGTPKRGLAWFAENDAGWSWNPATPNLTLTRAGDAVLLRVHLVNQPLELIAPRTITFGLQAAPVKPRLGDWRYKWKRDNYTLLGTDINWFALGDCGAVYPANKDLYYWEMLRRGNTERLDDATIEEVIARGLPLFDSYGKGDTWKAHVRYNLRSRFGQKMVLYYNRASYQLADEFQTFQDEWSLTDFRTVGKGNGIGEIKIVPTDSYIDHALYWYGKAFDVAGSVGVYWDNWFFVGSYNTQMTGAYRRADGSIMPSTGLWGLRELAKRTFVYMNERGMMPITMAHMTSTNILPLLSFCAVQYDWEWKYSEGDVQYRFPREYILLVSNGELAGTWPVLLGDHGKLATDPWTQRTFAAVCLVHELDCWGLNEVWEPLFKPIHELLDREGLQVYRYWDERPQPVVANHPELPTIVYSIPAEKAIVAVTSYAEEDLTATLTIDAKALGFSSGYRVVDVESGEIMPVQGHTLTLPLKKHDVREFRITKED